MSKMKIFLAVFAAVLLIAACGNKKDDTEPETPRDELIIGKWKSVLHREDGNIVPNSDYREFEFNEEGKVLIDEFEADGSPTDSSEENWELIDSDERIDFGQQVGVYDIIRMNADSMTLEYDKEDILSGGLVRRSDDFLKQ